MTSPFLLTVCTLNVLRNSEGGTWPLGLNAPTRIQYSHQHKGVISTAGTRTYVLPRMSEGTNQIPGNTDLHLRLPLQKKVFKSSPEYIVNARPLRQCLANCPRLRHIENA